MIFKEIFYHLISLLSSKGKIKTEQKTGLYQFLKHKVPKQDLSFPPKV